MKQITLHLPFFRLSLLLLPAVLLVIIAGCRNAAQAVQDNVHSEAILAILSADDELGTARNHASEDTSLAAAVRNYVAGIDSLDFSQCPADFGEAFRRHRDAWAATIPFFETYDTLRGEMHDLFAVIEERSDSTGQVAFARIQKPIWDTWAMVDSLAQQYGAGR